MTTLQNFPYFCQLDNEDNPYGSCNVTSIAMCLFFLGIRGDGSRPRLADQMYSRCEVNGFDRHDPWSLKQLAETYPGVIDDFTDAGSLAQIRSAINAGQPCVIHGWFTHSGHIITVKGYDDRGFIVNDPYGDWSRGGYDTSVSGEGLHYSTALIAATCVQGADYDHAMSLYDNGLTEAEASGGIWLHRLLRR